jgi:hypothetical protein
MYTLDSAISLISFFVGIFSIFGEIFFLEEKNEKKKCFFSKKKFLVLKYTHLI